jgi:hypothetical protein
MEATTLAIRRDRQGACMTLHVLSYGGGVQSTAMLVLAARGEIPHRTALFCNVGEDSENPDTLAFVRDYAQPFAKAHDVSFHALRKTLRDGTPDTVMQRERRTPHTIGIPMYMANGAPGNRSCTYAFKIAVVAKWTTQHGATRDDPAHVALGISIDEYQRMKPSRVPHQVSDYPLIDRRLSRADCRAIITDAGLPIPPKSSCWACPFQRTHQWQHLRKRRPDLFDAAVELERMENAKRAALGKDAMYLSSALKPLDEAIVDTGQLGLFDDDDDGTCDIGGYCFA